jgi:hypothetical protein
MDEPQRAEEVGCVAFLHKPFFANEINEVFEYRARRDTYVGPEAATATCVLRPNQALSLSSAQRSRNTTRRADKSSIAWMLSR